ncbi:MAG: hypothetical protein U0Z17_07310 [Bacteroidales bacterium]
MKQILKYAAYILLIIVVGYMVWRFSFMIVWMLIAAVISFIGQPIVRFFDKVHIRKWHIPHALGTALALILIVLMFFGLTAIFVPLIVNQAETISKIDVSLLAKETCRGRSLLLMTNFMPWALFRMGKRCRILSW